MRLSRRSLLRERPFVRFHDRNLLGPLREKMMTPHEVAGVENPEEVRGFSLADIKARIRLSCGCTGPSISQEMHASDKE